MKKALFVALALFCLPVLSQTPDQVLRDLLGLTDPQVAAVHELMESRRAAIEPLQNQIHEAEAQLAQMIASPSPDPCAIGTLMQSIRSLQQQAEQHLAAFREGLSAVLNEEQKKRLEFIFSVERAVHAAAVLHQIGL